MSQAHAGNVGQRYAVLFTAALSVSLVAHAAPAQEQRCAVLEVFVRGDAERSQEAIEFIEKTYRGRKGLSVAIRDVTLKDADLDRFYMLAEHFKVAKPGLPAFYVSSRFEWGWDEKTSPARLEEALTVEVFVRQGCPRCAAAKPIIFNQIAPRYPAYKFVEKDLVTSAEARNRLQEVSNRYRVNAASVPALHMCGKLMVGYFDPQTSFRQWDDVLKGATTTCKENKPSTDDKTSAITPFHVPIPSNSWFSTVAYAAEEPPTGRAPTPSETSEVTADEPPPPNSLPQSQTTLKVSPPTLAAAPSIESADAPPPRPRRVLPEETAPALEPQVAPDPPSTSQSDLIDLPVLGQVNWRDWGLPAFTVAVGLIDGFNPCAMWVLLFLLSLLVNLGDRWKILAVAGTFVFISGAAYFAFMTAWLQVAQWFALLRPVQITLGLLGVGVGAIHVKDFFAFKQGVSLSIPESAKPTIYEYVRRIVHAETVWAALTGASVLAVLVNFLELLCTAGLPAMYTGILTMQELPTWQNYLYLLLYIAAYMFDDSLMVAIVVVTLGKHKLQEKGGRMLKLVSGLVILSLGLVLLFKPEWVGQ